MTYTSTLTGDDPDLGHLYNRATLVPALAQVPHKLQTRCCHIGGRWQRGCLLPIHPLHMAGFGSAVVSPSGKHLTDLVQEDCRS